MAKEGEGWRGHEKDGAHLRALIALDQGVDNLERVE